VAPATSSVTFLAARAKEARTERDRDILTRSSKQARRIEGVTC
jgi:hypothetical protein